jgi:glycosyltransferase involved in cell wall biosynthesis
MKKENKIVLSISLLCSGRNKKELVKCLESLMTIRKSLPSEIIVVDTGCDKESHSVLEKYADQVVNFTWCDDFAKARNAGLERCTGEWFMFIDDDEWFENTDAIVDFFRSGEYKHFGSARYIVRNYENHEGTEYNDTWALRLVKHVDGLHFHGKIHEYPTPRIGECRMIDSFVHHYGYVYDSRDDLLKKARRNIDPLYEMIKEEPKNIHWRSQLVQELTVIEDYGRLSELCEATIDMLKDSTAPLVGRNVSDFYVGMLIADNCTDQYDKTISDYSKYISDNRIKDVCRASLDHYVAAAYWHLDDMDKCYTYTEDYLKIYQAMQDTGDLDEAVARECGLMDRNVFRGKIVQYSLCMLISSAAVIGHYSVADSYMKYIDWDSIDNARADLLCQGLTKAITNHEYDSVFTDIVDRIITHNKTQDRAVFYARLCESAAEKNYEALEEKQDAAKKFDRLVNVYGQTVDNNHWYINYLHLRYYDDIEDEEKINSECNALLTSVIDIFSLDKRVWEIAVKWGIGLPSIFTKINYESWKVATDSFLTEHSQDRADVVSIVDKIIRGDNDVRFRYFRLKEKEMDLINVVNTAKNEYKVEKILDILPEYCRSCVSFYQDIYTSEWFTGEMTVLPPQCRFAVRFLEAIDIDNKINSSDRIKELEKCVDIYAPFNPALGEYIKEYGEREKTKLLQIQKKPELEKVYQMLDLLKQAIELQENTGSEELQEGIMHQRQLVENIIAQVDENSDKLDNKEWLLEVTKMLS